jgi:hypothetical protein
MTELKTPGRRSCVICRQTGGILICSGCQLTFCAKHVVKHREELTYRLESIIDNHHLLRQDIEEPLNEEIHLRKIDQWEKDSIKKIRKAAETARAELRQIIDQSKRRLKKIARDIAFDLNAAWKSDDFAEHDLTKWTKQLNELQADMKSAYGFQWSDDHQRPIYPITFMYTKNQFRNNKNDHRQSTSRASNSVPYECFIKTSQSASIENNGSVAKHVGPSSDYAHVIGKQLYSKGIHTIRFKILQSSPPYTIFFGCISSETPLDSIYYKSSYVVGWFGYNEVYHHGVWSNNLKSHGYESNEIRNNDILHLIFDCDHKQIDLFHARINKTYRLPVNIEKAPFPWQFLVVLTNEDDSVKLLSSTNS